MEQTMFEKLQQLPLFTALTKHELMSIVEKAKFHFAKHAEGSTIATQNEPCERIVYVLSGTVLTERHDDSLKIILSEHIDRQPMLLELHSTWGMSHRFERTYTFGSAGSTCSIDKHTICEIVSEYDNVRINMLNLLCTRVQQSIAVTRQPLATAVGQRFLRFVLAQSAVPYGRKTLYAKMQDVARHIDVTRLNLSAALHQWQDQGLVEIRRNAVHIPDIARLTAV